MVKGVEMDCNNCKYLYTHSLNYTEIKFRCKMKKHMEIKEVVKNCSDFKQKDIKTKIK